MQVSSGYITRQSHVKKGVTKDEAKMSEYELRKCYSYGWLRRILFGLAGIFVSLLVLVFLVLAITVVITTLATE